MKKYIFAILACLSISFSSLIVEATAATGEYSYNGMGRIVLEKNIVNNVNILTQDMLYKGEAGSRIPNTNTIFIIQYDFVLAEDITIPDGCVLDFDGGSISGLHTLTLNKTYIQGKAQFDVTITGEVSNELFNVVWMKGSDIGEQINKAGANFKALIIPQGSYVFTTPVILQGINYLNCLASLTYNGTKKNCEGIFLIKNSNQATIQIASLYPFDVNFDHSDSRIINFVGLEVRNCSNCNFDIGSIGYFNENLRITGNANEGGVGQCSNNTWLLKNIHNGNYNVRIYQEGGGYCNEQNFIGGHLANYTSNINYGKKYYFGIGGPAIDLDSYLPNKPSDSYDKVNAIKIVDMNLETANSGPHHTPAFLFRNITSLSLVRNRYEGQASSSTTKSKAIGQFRISQYELSYDNILPYIDLSETLNGYNDVIIPFSGYKKKINIYDIKTINDKYTAYKCYVADRDAVLNITGALYSSAGFIVKTSTSKTIKLQANASCRFIVYYLDENNRNITSQNTDKPCKLGFYSPDFYGFSNGSNSSSAEIFIPEGINKVFVGLIFTLANGATEFEVEAASGTIMAEYPALYGTTANRPAALPANVSYYDTTINKKIWFNGNSKTGWIDANGTPI